jgi:transcriptional regulator with XRE-family HTH domain
MVQNRVGARHSTQEFQELLGERIRAQRIREELTQDDLARRAGVSTSTVHHLERGTGGTVATLIKVLRALQATDWLDALGPTPSTISPLQILRDQRRIDRAPQRVRKRRR